MGSDAYQDQTNSRRGTVDEATVKGHLVDGWDWYWVGDIPRLYFSENCCCSRVAMGCQELDGGRKNKTEIPRVVSPGGVRQDLR